jgi:hypothetical protein
MAMYAAGGKAAAHKQPSAEEEGQTLSKKQRHEQLQSLVQ